MITHSRFYYAFVLLLITTLTVSGFVNIPQAVASSDFERSVTIPVKVVLVGFDETQIDTRYLAWSGSGKNLPDAITNIDLDTGNSTGIVFRPQYSMSFASSSFKDNFVSYLRSIERKTTGRNPWFGQYQLDTDNPDYVTSVPLATDYVVYDANSVEDWLWNHGSDVGGYPENGWTIIVAYLPELPSVSWMDVQAFKRTNGEELPKTTPHYYGISHTDADLGYKARYRDFMNAWGGHHRMWFVDLSAGPVFNSEYEDLPLQVAIGDNNIDITRGFGKSWLTEYVSDYVWQATLNFVAPSFVYYPQYVPNYQIDVFILDDRNSVEKQKVPIENTVSKEMIASALRDLVPYSKVTVNLNYPEISDRMHELIRSNRKFADSWIYGSLFASPQRYEVVDLRPIYRYVLDNIGLLDPNPRLTEDTMTIPVFAFAFSGETYFTYAYKWDIGKVDWETGALLGVALKECVFVSLNQWEFTRGEQVDPRQPGKGDGFTQTIIHEVGHEFGLMHPHQYGNIGDFVYSAMGYFTDDYEFGLTDKDALQRAHVDQLYLQTLELLTQTDGSSAAQDAATKIRDKLAEVDSAYVKMEYGSAIQPALEAYALAKQSAQKPATTQTHVTQPEYEPSGTKDQPLLYLVAGLAVGLVVAVVVFVVMKRQTTRGKEPSATRTHAVAAQRCVSCGNEIMSQSLFCEHCGANQR
jgi:hypothetical protein